MRPLSTVEQSGAASTKRSGVLCLVTGARREELYHPIIIDKRPQRSASLLWDARGASKAKYNIVFGPTRATTATTAAARGAKELPPPGLGLSVGSLPSNNQPTSAYKRRIVSASLCGAALLALLRHASLQH